MSESSPLAAVAACTSVLLLIATTPNAWAMEPEAGRFLVAAEALEDPNFAKTVVLLLHHDGDGSIGLIINQHSDIAPAQLLPGIRGLDRYQGKLFLGGPVELSHVSVLAAEGAGGTAVLKGVYLSNDPTTLEGLLLAARGQGERAVRIFIGYAGWSGGQLEAEISAGGWRVHAASAKHVFEQDPSRLWGSLREAASQSSPDEPFVVRALPATGSPTPGASR
ncbi:MAG: YqgE/AlgH family protein [Pseudomonadota bacterium]